MELQITRTIRLPDPVNLARHERTPELGPAVLFFSGGTALRNVSLELIRYTHNSIHVITPFDSGGSSALLREAFLMPAIGDVRNRLLALADRTLRGNPEIFSLFAHRFPKEADQADLERELDAMIEGEHELIAAIPDPMRKIIRQHLDLFKGFMPNGFDLRKASLGNLVLTAGYLENRRNFDVIIYIFSKLVNVRGIVKPVINKYLHLVTELADGRVFVGQHLLTGKEANPIQTPVKKVWLSADRENPVPVDVPIRNKMRKLVRKADLICYPIGSLYSSVIANLLPVGVGAAVSETDCPKVFVPNTAGKDPEAFGLTLTGQIETLLRYLRKDDPNAIRTRDVLHYVLVDAQKGDYPGGVDYKAIEAMGLRVINLPLVSETSHPYIDEKLLAPVLMSLA